MKPLFQLSTRRYDEEITIIKKAMKELESNCKVKDGFEIKEPFAKAGWTFFNLVLSAEMESVIENSDMIHKIWRFLLFGFSLFYQASNRFS